MSEEERAERAKPMFSSADEQFAASIRKLRRQSGMTTFEFTEKLNEQSKIDWHESVIYKIERGERRVSIGEAIALAKVLNVRVSGLIPEFLNPESDRFQSLTERVSFRAREYDDQIRRWVADAELLRISWLRLLADLTEEKEAVIELMELTAAEQTEHAASIDEAEGKAFRLATEQIQEMEAIYEGAITELAKKVSKLMDMGDRVAVRRLAASLNVADSSAPSDAD